METSYKNFRMRNSALARARRVTLCFLALIATGCGLMDPQPSETNSFPVPDLTSAKRLAALSKAHCTDPSRCSPSVAMLVATTSRMTFQCTSFLVSDNVMATNSHCIPGDLKAAGSDCRDRIAFVFPSVGSYPEQRAQCSRVLLASEIDQSFRKPDYAFVQLASPVARSPLKISREGMSDNGSYQVLKMDPYQGNGIPEGFLHQEQCKAVYHSLVANGAASPQAPVMALGDCLVVHGNSGSPVLDSRDQVVGVLFAKIDSTALDSTLEQKGVTQLDPDLAPMALATSYSCVPLPPGLADEPPDACQGASSAASGDEPVFPGADLRSRIDDELKRKFQEAEPSLDSDYQWRLAIEWGKSVDGQGLVSDSRFSALALPVPKCALPAQRTSGARTEEGTLSVPVWAIEFGVNRYAQESYRATDASLAGAAGIQLQFDPDRLKRQGRTTIRGEDSVAGALEPLYTGELGVCPLFDPTGHP